MATTNSGTVCLTHSHQLFISASKWNEYLKVIKPEGEVQIVLFPSQPCNNLPTTRLFTAKSVQLGLRLRKMNKM